jgi:hypothetical protein
MDPAHVVHLAGNHARATGREDAAPCRGHRQLDRLWSSRCPRVGLGALMLCRSGNTGDLGPRLEGLSAGGSILDGGAVIAAEVEEIVDLVVGGEETLSLPG